MPVTSRRSHGVQAACSDATRKAIVPVRCPAVLPGGRMNASVLLPRRSTLRGPYASGDAGRYRYRDSRHLYVIEMQSSALDDVGHLLVGGGRPADVYREALHATSDRLPPATELQPFDRRVSVRRFPRYPEGGINGGHVVATATRRELLLFASVHGYQHQDLAVALLVSMLR